MNVTVILFSSLLLAIAFWFLIRERNQKCRLFWSYTLWMIVCIKGIYAYFCAFMWKLSCGFVSFNQQTRNFLNNRQLQGWLLILSLQCISIQWKLSLHCVFLFITLFSVGSGSLCVVLFPFFCSEVLEKKPGTLHR